MGLQLITDLVFKYPAEIKKKIKTKTNTTMVQRDFKDYDIYLGERPPQCPINRDQVKASNLFEQPQLEDNKVREAAIENIRTRGYEKRE